jgi:hypothetical protein
LKPRASIGRRNVDYRGLESGYDHHVGRVARGVGGRYAKPLLAGLLSAVLILAFRQSIPPFEGLPAILLFAPFTLAVFFGLLVCLGLYPSDRRFLASFAGALKDVLGRETAR